MRHYTSLNETVYLLNRCMEASLRLGRELHGALEAEGDRLTVILLEETNLIPKLTEFGAFLNQRPQRVVDYATRRAVSFSLLLVFCTPDSCL